MSKLEDAEALLKSLERHGHAVDDARNALAASEYTGDPEKIATARATLNEAIEAERAAAVSPRDIARAAQAVLDARGEAHTETNILPPGGSQQMNIGDNVTLSEALDAAAKFRTEYGDSLTIEGVYEATCVAADGSIRWRDLFVNTVVTVGVNAMFDAALAGSAYTVTGPFMGLISSVGYSAISNADTMTSHAGWTEAGGTNAPTYTAPRKTCVWSAASARSKALSAALAFAITGTGTIKGAFIVYGTGAVSTIDNTGGTLFSAGLFTGGDRLVANLDTVNVSYSVSG